MSLTTVHALSEFVELTDLADPSVTYWYEGYCPQGNKLLRLPRTVWAEKIADGLMRQLAAQPCFSEEGKMYGILLVETPTGEQQVLQAFSGLLHGESYLEGWVPPISGRECIRLEEAQTLKQLNAIQQKLITLAQIEERQQYEILSQELTAELAKLDAEQKICKRERLEKRQQLLETLTGAALEAAFEQLDEQSRQAGIVRRRLKQEQNAVLQPLKQAIDQADAQIRQLKLRRKALSRHLQTQMHQAYRLVNFAGESASIQSLQQFVASGGLPTGTGDCCAPKLLHYAATHGFKPVAMAEFWWGSATGDKIPGEFYGACIERCQPILGFLLSGLPPLEPSLEPQLTTLDLRLTVVAEDDWLIAVNKPAGLLSVPGRYFDRQDSVVSRLREAYPNLQAIHRLDQDTSGILLLAKDHATYRTISQQFQHRQVHKIYEAILIGRVASTQGTVDLALRADFAHRPRQMVDPLHGKPSLSHFRVLAADPLKGELTRVEWLPLTGRTHQLRVHAAVGLGAPILGDRLYGAGVTAERLHLHARELKFLHPQSGQPIHLRSETPF
jgi:tRNA pseudouridine32 synthase/23S rRNA pseudouridine746 synthase